MRDTKGRENETKGDRTNKGPVERIRIKLKEDEGVKALKNMGSIQKKNMGKNGSSGNSSGGSIGGSSSDSSSGSSSGSSGSSSSRS
jgi:hypothetical protein